MKILMITPYLPYPLFSGGQVRSYNIIKHLSSKNEIVLFSLIRKEEEKQYTSQLDKYCKKVVVFKRKKAFRVDNIVLSGLTSWPFILHVYNHSELKAALKKELKRERYDLIHVETFYIMQNLPNTDIPIVLFEQNIEYKVYERIARYFDPSIFRPLLFFDVAKIRKWEEYFWKKASAVVVMSEVEKVLVGERAFVCGNGVDTNFYKLMKRKRTVRVLFLGNFKWFQSLDAVNFILSEIWPRLKAKLPEAKLFIVGKNLPERLRRKGHPDIVFNNNAPDDTRKIYEQADVLLAPIRAGGGASFKVLESMATGLPVVTTPLVEKVLLARDREELLAVNENDPEMFAQKTAELLQDQELYKRIARNARRLVEKRYDWKIIIKKLERVYDEVTRNSREY